MPSKPEIKPEIRLARPMILKIVMIILTHVIDFIN